MSAHKIIFKKFIVFSGSIILIDQLSKILVQKFWPSIFFCNSQMALGFPKIAWFYWILYLMIFFFLLNLIKKNPKSCNLFLILGGAISNLLDRLFIGCIMDWINLLSWIPVFNVADVAISLGIIGFFWQSKKST